jgi:endonuclease/exonuclease/phosphatase family metal-dependent hydrolase/2'-5' RNA ligase
MATPINLSSTKTALAIVAPGHLCSEIDGIRSIHDKAFGKWDAHINILYPFVPHSLLDTAISEVRKALLHERRGSLRIFLDDVGVFKHRKNATVFLKPSNDTEEAVRQMRDNLITSLISGKKFKHSDGVEFIPHLTIGQASLQENEDLVTLDEKARKLLPMDWEATHLVVLRRDSSGEMIPIEQIPFGDPGAKTADKATDTTTIIPVKRTMESIWRGWRCCYHLNSNLEWEPIQGQAQNTEAPSTCLIVSLNLMVEDHAPEFELRLPFIERHVAQLIDHSKPMILCLQEVNPEMLSLIYATPLFQQYFPYSSHMPDSPMQSLRNQVIISSLPFRAFSLQYTQPYKSSLIAKFLDHDLTVVNIHLTSALTDQAVLIKREQMEKLTKLLARHNMLHEAVLAGDFNVTTSSETIRTALEKGIIHSETVQNLQQVVDTAIWSDAFLECQPQEDGDDADLFPGEEGATFDRLNNPLAAMGKAPIDHRPQRLDRILFARAGSIEIQHYDRFAVPRSPYQAVSDHYGIYAIIGVSSRRPSSSAMQRESSDLQALKAEELKPVEDPTDIRPLVEEFLPTRPDRAQREEALGILHNMLCQDNSLQNIAIVPLGSYALDTYFRDSDIDVLVIGDVAPRQYFDILLTYFTGAGSKAGIAGVHLINSLVQIAEVVINGIKIDVQYCEAKELLER